MERGTGQTLTPSFSGFNTADRVPAAQAFVALSEVRIMSSSLTDRSSISGGRERDRDTFGAQDCYFTPF